MGVLKYKDSNGEFHKIPLTSETKVEVSPLLEEGTEIGSIFVNGDETVLYAPAGGASSWSEVADKPFKSLDSDDFSIDSDGVLSVIGGGGDTTIEGDVYYAYDEYDTEEKVIGVWTDGKPLYRKVIEASVSIPREDWANICSVSDIEQIKNAELLISTNIIHPDILFKIEDGMLAAYNSYAWAITTTKVIIEYTKTTDTADSFKPSMVTDNKVLISSAPYYEDYSTEEKVVGCWIDGKPIYRKTFGETTLSLNSITNLISNSDNAINHHLMYYRSEDATWFNPFEVGSDYIHEEFYNNGSLGIYITAANSSVNKFKGYIEYTKTTDAKNSFTPDMMPQSALIDTVSDDDVSAILAQLESE